jgi:hypothetical protein
MLSYTQHTQEKIMKNIAISLLAALTLSTPAYAWKNEYFAKLDTDASGELTAPELVAAGCRVNPKLFIYADKDRSKGLTKAEYFNNRDLFGRCK